MGTATVIFESVAGFFGEARCYKLDPPLDGNEYVTVIAVDMPGTQHDETLIVPAYSNGSAILMNRLPGSITGWADHEKCLQIAGYTVAPQNSKPGLTEAS